MLNFPISRHITLHLLHLWLSLCCTETNYTAAVKEAVSLIRRGSSCPMSRIHTISLRLFQHQWSSQPIGLRRCQIWCYHSKSEPVLSMDLAERHSQLFSQHHWYHYCYRRYHPCNALPKLGSCPRAGQLLQRWQEYVRGLVQNTHWSTDGWPPSPIWPALTCVKSIGGNAKRPLYHFSWY